MAKSSESETQCEKSVSRNKVRDADSKTAKRIGKSITDNFTNLFAEVSVLVSSILLTGSIDIGDYTCKYR